MQIQLKYHNRPTIVSAKVKFYSPRRGYLSPGNSIVLEIAAAAEIFISVTNSCTFWGSFCLNSSNLPVHLYMFVSYAALRAYCHHGHTLLRSHTRTHLQPGDKVCSALTVHYHKSETTNICVVSFKRNAPTTRAKKKKKNWKWLRNAGLEDQAEAVLSYGPYGPVCAFIVKLLTKSPYEGCTHLREKGRKSRTALLGTRTALCHAILEYFVTSKHPTYLQPESKYKQTTIIVIITVTINTFVMIYTKITKVLAYFH